MATHTSPADWGAPVDQTMLLTVVDILNDQARQARRAR